MRDAPMAVAAIDTRRRPAAVTLADHRRSWPVPVPAPARWAFRWLPRKLQVTCANSTSATNTRASRPRKKTGAFPTYSIARARLVAAVAACAASGAAVDFAKIFEETT